MTHGLPDSRAWAVPCQARPGELGRWKGRQRDGAQLGLGAGTGSPGRKAACLQGPSQEPMSSAGHRHPRPGQSRERSLWAQGSAGGWPASHCCRLPEFVCQAEQEGVQPFKARATDISRDWGTLAPGHPDPVHPPDMMTQGDSPSDGGHFFLFANHPSSREAEQKGLRPKLLSSKLPLSQTNRVTWGVT